MKEYLQQHKKKIVEYLEDYEKNAHGIQVRSTAIDENVLSTLIGFSKRGKMLRGGLVQLGYSLFRDEKSADVIVAGACLELLQSALLIHDDIMDRDKTRRYEPSIYFGYRNKAVDLEIEDAYHTGESMGICAGDIAFFSALDILTDMNCSCGIYKKIIESCSREMMLVGMAQMEDIYSSTTRKMSSRETIFDLYRQKTGRYSFSLPLNIGALLAEADESEIGKLYSIGEKMGILFQIKDDELGLFSSEEVLGKPVGGDIREGKKTIYIQLLHEKSGSTDKAILEHALGNPDITIEDIDQIRSLMEKYGVRNEVKSIIDEFSEEFQQDIERLSGCRAEAKAMLKNIHDYNLMRAF